jgi:hypothetical protein
VGSGEEAHYTRVSKQSFSIKDIKWRMGIFSGEITADYDEDRDAGDESQTRPGQAARFIRWPGVSGGRPIDNEQFADELL